MKFYKISRCVIYYIAFFNLCYLWLFEAIDQIFFGHYMLFVALYSRFHRSWERWKETWRLVGIYLTILVYWIFCHSNTSPTKRTRLDWLRMDLLLPELYCQALIVKRTTWEKFAHGSKLQKWHWVIQKYLFLMTFPLTSLT